MLLWSSCIPQHCVHTWPALCSLLGTGQRGSNNKAQLSRFFIILHSTSCWLKKTILGNVRKCQGGAEVNGTSYFIATIYYSRKNNTFPSLSICTHRLGIRMWELPPLIPLSVYGNKIQEGIIVPVTHKLFSTDWNTENLLTFRWADKLKKKKILEERVWCFEAWFWLSTYFRKPVHKQPHSNLPASLQPGSSPSS